MKRIRLAGALKLLSLLLLIGLDPRGSARSSEVVLYAAPEQLAQPRPAVYRGAAPASVLRADKPDRLPQPTALPPSAPSGHDLPFAGLAELSADALVREVLARNPSLAQMGAAWQAARARYPQVTSLDDPMFGAMLAPLSIGRNDVDFGGRVEVSQKCPFPGKLALRGQQALAEANAAGQDVLDTRLQLIESAQSAFADYYLVFRALEVNEVNLRLLRKYRATAQARYEDKLVPLQDVLQTDVEIGRQQERQLTLERMSRVAVARLNTLMHLPPDNLLPPPPRRIDPAQSLPDPRTLLDTARARRPDLRALADQIAAMEAALALAHKDYYPDFELIAAYDSMMGNGPTRPVAAQIGVRINLPVRLARRAAALAEAQARLCQRRAELARRVDQVNFEVQQAYEQVRESAKTVLLYRQTILLKAQQNVESAESAYVDGMIPALSLIEAQRSLVGLRDRYYEAVTDYFRRLATLERVIGGPLGAPPPAPRRCAFPASPRPAAAPGRAMPAAARSPG